MGKVWGVGGGEDEVRVRVEGVEALRVWQFVPIPVDLGRQSGGLGRLPHRGSPACGVGGLVGICSSLLSTRPHQALTLQTPQIRASWPLRRSVRPGRVSQGFHLRAAAVGLGQEVSRS